MRRWLEGSDRLLDGRQATTGVSRRVAAAARMPADVCPRCGANNGCRCLGAGGQLYGNEIRSTYVSSGSEEVF